MPSSHTRYRQAKLHTSLATEPFIDPHRERVQSLFELAYEANIDADPGSSALIPNIAAYDQYAIILEDRLRLTRRSESNSIDGKCQLSRSIDTNSGKWVTQDAELHRSIDRISGIRARETRLGLIHKASDVANGGVKQDVVNSEVQKLPSTDVLQSRRADGGNCALTRLKEILGIFTCGRRA